jgi:hypothetical protein
MRFMLLFSASCCFVKALEVISQLIRNHESPFAQFVQKRRKGVRYFCAHLVMLHGVPSVEVSCQ